MATVEADRLATDIDALLRAVETKVSARETPAYALGKEEGVRELYEKLEKDIRKQHEKTMVAAEIFCKFCISQIPDLKVKQIRVGTDPATTLNTAVLIVEGDCAEHQRKLMDMARAVERFCYESFGFFGNLWTLVDEGLDADMVCSDFPLFRRVRR